MSWPGGSVIVWIKKLNSPNLKYFALEMLLQAVPLSAGTLWSSNWSTDVPGPESWCAAGRWGVHGPMRGYPFPAAVQMYPRREKHGALWVRL